MPCVAHPAKNMRGLEGIFFPLKMMLSYIIQNIKSHSSRKNTSNHNNMCIEYVFGSVSRLLHLCFLLSFSFSFFFFFFFFHFTYFALGQGTIITVQSLYNTVYVLYQYCLYTVAILFTHLKILKIVSRYYSHI